MDTRNTLANIRIVMIQTSHPGNIGSAARAMKVMGLSHLTLVKPKSFPDEQANAMSSHADDILQNAKVVQTLQEAIADCHLVIGSSARFERNLNWDVLDSRECGAKTAKQCQSGKVALLFGRESSGLNNEELSLCHHLVHIPTNPKYSSLNVASAVQILAYECRLATSDLSINKNSEDVADIEKPVSASEMEGYFAHLEEVMQKVDFLDPENPGYLMPRLRRLYSRTGILESELKLLRGFLSAIQKKL